MAAPRAQTCHSALTSSPVASVMTCRHLTPIRLSIQVPKHISSGYGTSRKQNRYTKAMKRRIDRNFRKDLHGVCQRYSLRHPFKAMSCEALANIYYGAVRLFANQPHHRRDKPNVSCKGNQKAETLTRNRSNLIL